jgi:4-hydroxy-3-methylbut-2-enyl diphosphate reductase
MTTSARDSKDGIIKRGFGLKSEIAGELSADYHSGIIEQIKANDNRWQVGDLHLRIAAQFGFCYGVDKAIDFAYETHRQFPDKRIFLTHEIIHNPRVNRRLVEMGIQFMASKQQPVGTPLEAITADDVVLLPAFGVDHGLLEQLRSIGCVLVDTTCGSVVHVWKRVERYAREGFTAVIHGKYQHEETIATSSYVTKYGAHYLIVFDKPEAALVCEYIRTGRGAAELAAKFAPAISPGFNFHKHLMHIGCANQTTMLSSESLEIAEMFRQALSEKYGPEDLPNRFRSFDTICSATQERQDAVVEMMRQPPDLMLVVGGFNSSNTTHLCEIASQFCPTYHVDEIDCLISPHEIRHRPPHVGAEPEIARDWLPARRPLEIGLTAGASTPNRVIGDVIERLSAWERGD